MTINKVVKLATVVEGGSKAPFSIAITPRCKGGQYCFPRTDQLYSKREGIKYHFLSLWNDLTWDWTQFSRAIGEHYKIICII